MVEQPAGGKGEDGGREMITEQQSIVVFGSLSAIQRAEIIRPAGLEYPFVLSAYCRVKIVDGNNQPFLKVTGS